MTISAFHSGVAGIHTSFNNLRQDAQRIAGASGAADDLTSPLLNLQRDKTQALAATKVVRAADAMVGSIIDIKV